MHMFFGALLAVAVIVTGGILIGGILAAVSGISGILGMLALGVAKTGVFVITVASLGLSAKAYINTVSGFAGSNLPDITMLPLFAIGPEEIFEGKIAAFDINFFHPKEVIAEFEDENGKKEAINMKEYDDYMTKNPSAVATRFYYKDEKGNEIDTSRQNTAMDLSSTVSNWYYTIRNIAIVFMMLILLYIGIRMMLCSIASEKSKYKKMLVDWVVSMCLMFVLHYVMVFAVNINEKIVKMVSDVAQKRGVYYIPFDEDMDEDRKKSFINSLYESTKTEYNQNYTNKDGKANFLDSDADPNDHVDDIKGFLWFTNLIGQIRLGGQNEDGTTEYIGYTIAYLTLVFYTVFFCFTYLKRVVYMAFLTIIAPFVAMTYSLDKIADGKAQAFNMWIKEYIFNLLIQPMHLMLYVILISMSYELASKSVIYMLVAIGFMIPAEKFVRKMFGFEKAQTPGMLGGAAGAAIAMDGMKRLSSFAGHGNTGAKSGNKPVEKLDKSQEDNSSFSGKGIDFLADQMKNESEGGDQPKFEENSLESNDAINTNSEPNSPALGSSSNNPDDRTRRQIRFAKLGDGIGNARDRINEARDKFDDGIGNIKNKANKLGNNIANSKLGRGASKYIARPAKWTAKKIAQNQDTIAKTIKTGARLTGAVVGAGIGAAAGIASGDISNVGKNMALGASAGDSIGTGLSNRAGSVVSTIQNDYKGAKERKERKKYGENYSEHVKEEKIKELMSGQNYKETRRYIANEYSNELNGKSASEKREILDKKMEQYKEYMVDTGSTDRKLIVKAMKLDKNNPTSNESKSALVMAEAIKKDRKNFDTYKDRLAERSGNKEAANRVANNAARLAGLYK